MFYRWDSSISVYCSPTGGVAKMCEWPLLNDGMKNCMMTVNLMRDGSLPDSVRIFERQKDVLRSGMSHAANFNDRKFREVARPGEKLFYEQEGCCVDRSIPDTDRQTQIFVSWNTRNQLAGYRTRAICDAEFRSLDFENLPPLFTRSSFFSVERAHAGDHHWSRLTVRTRSGRK